MSERPDHDESSATEQTSPGTLSRRGFLVTASAAGLSLILPACGGTAPAPTAAPAAKPAEPAKPAAPPAAAPASASPAAQATAAPAAAAKPATGAIAGVEEASPEVWLVRDMQLSPAWALADVKGWFKEAGVNPQVKWFQSGTDLPNMLAAGSVKLASGSGALGITSRAAGVKSLIIAQQTQHAGNTGLAIDPKAGIKEPADLIGKKIGMPTGTSVELAFRNFAKEFNLDFTKFTFVNGQPADLLTALGKGDIQAICLWEPWITNAIKQFGSQWYWRSNHSYVPGKEGPRDYVKLTAYVVTLEDYYAKNPNTLKAVLTGLKKGVDYLQDKKNHPEVAKLLAESLRIPADDGEKMLGQIGFKMDIDNDMIDAIKMQTELLRLVNRLPRDVPPEEYVQPALLKSLYPDLVKWEPKRS